MLGDVQYGPNLASYLAIASDQPDQTVKIHLHMETLE